MGRKGRRGGPGAGAPTAAAQGPYGNRQGQRRGGVPTHLIAVKGTAELHKRMRIAAAEEGMSYAQLIWLLLDARDERMRRQRRHQNHPLSPPTTFENGADPYDDFEGRPPRLPGEVGGNIHGGGYRPEDVLREAAEAQNLAEAVTR